MKTSFTISDIKKLIIQLKNENNTSNNELIAFYEKKVQIESLNALQKMNLNKIIKNEAT